jgi:hypothetical protein
MTEKKTSAGFSISLTALGPNRSPVLLRADGMELRAPPPFAYAADGKLILPAKRDTFIVILDFPVYLDRVEEGRHGKVGLVFWRWRPHSGWQMIEMPSGWIFSWTRWVQRGVWPADMRLFKRFILLSVGDFFRENSYAGRTFVSRQTDGDG